MASSQDTKMQDSSKYCKYNQTSSTYDMARRPLDLDDLVNRIEALATSRNVEVKDLKMLDIGAGSGNYYHALRGRKVDIKYHGLEGSEGMINQFNAKVQNDERFSLQLCDLTQQPLDLKNESFDVVIVTQVLHHLSDGSNKNYTNIYNLMKELSRVISTGGVLWVQTMNPPHQPRDGHWWASLIPKACEKFSGNYPPMKEFTTKLEEVNFKEVQTRVPGAPLMDIKLYSDVSGPLKEEWRNCHSMWSCVDGEELVHALKKLQGIIDEKKSDEFFAEREEQRAKFGQTTTVTAVKGDSQVEVSEDKASSQNKQG